MQGAPLRKQIACEIYDLRGIDFFLVYYMDKQTTAYNDNRLWDSANLIIEFLNESGRQEEAIRVAEELESRKEKFKEIITEYSSIDSESISGMFENLIDAFVTEVMLKKGVLRGWSQVVLSLCKVLEKEAADVLFTKWIELIQKAVFRIPPDVSKKVMKRIKSREITFRTLKSCSESPVKSPTLGQLVFVSKFWSDDIMTQCTTLFSEINKKAESYCQNFALKIQELSLFLEDKHYYSKECPSFLDLRNASAHPGHEDDFTWSEHIPWLKEFLGKPPKEVLRLVMELKGK